ncbi:DUF554 domain-containing protein [Tetragenococcus koreensis]|uniref:DUF554 domain-containing protein n=1 Tax=Tetragenococcus koreensis TaxID=290335 RepID=UPI000F4D7FA3|nr:DUF554 domain-containing protein [Tetragenococcus koreensis]AYW45509.1 DUF554 domain-containing protein [Tetragenococcus koreensis]MCF1617533.1 DUF554 domain-containing protein [Tetragenococcus koreensis]MCF1622909.1 DUF554 domain-containing protein [Tetragenococcus koreensis]MCF1630848.1 DUF554 domain-containing protein [Tetragenococcus koreensis]MCF1678457.1 DUF554 domain-containing protein [Tetragenococcus koreensis]
MLTGVFINGLAIAIGSLIGILLRNISEEMKETVTKGIGLGVVVLGIQMAIPTQSFIVIMISLSIGALIGEALKIETLMNRFGLFLQKRFSKSESNFAEGFVTASLIFVIGSLGIIGAIQSGVSGDHETLLTKAVMDGFMAIMLTASFGYGVLFSSIPVVLYQGSIAILANFLVQLVSPSFMDELMNEISAIGGLMILGIGLNLLQLTKLRVSNFLPGIVVLIILLSLKFVI